MTYRPGFATGGKDSSGSRQESTAGSYQHENKLWHCIKRKRISSPSERLLTYSEGPCSTKLHTAVISCKELVSWLQHRFVLCIFRDKFDLFDDYSIWCIHTHTHYVDKFLPHVSTVCLQRSAQPAINITPCNYLFHDSLNQFESANYFISDNHTENWSIMHLYFTNVTSWDRCLSHFQTALVITDNTSTLNRVSSAVIVTDAALDRRPELQLSEVPLYIAAWGIWL
jgi:hypothetical protein